MTDDEPTQLIVTKLPQVDVRDLIWGFAFVPESVLKEVDIVTIKPRKILKDKITVNKALMFCDLDKFHNKTKAIIEYE